MKCTIKGCEREATLKYNVFGFCGKYHATRWFSQQLEPLPRKSEATYSISTDSAILKQLNMSRKMKIKKGWSRELGAGFIVADIKSIETKGKDLLFSFCCGTQVIAVRDLNLRETEEAITFMRLKIAGNQFEEAVNNA